jgi:hypothetical protein
MAKLRGVGQFTLGRIGSRGVSQIGARGGSQLTWERVGSAPCGCAWVHAHPWLDRLIGWLVQMMDQSPQVINNMYIYIYVCVFPEITAN